MSDDASTDLAPEPERTPRRGDGSRPMMPDRTPFWWALGAVVSGCVAVVCIVLLLWHG